MAKATGSVIVTWLLWISCSIAAQGGDSVVSAHSLRFPLQGDGGISISLVFKGYLFKDPVTGAFPSISKMPSGMRDDEAKFVAKVIEQNRQGNKPGIVALWRKSERKKIAQSMNRARLFSRNTAFFKNVTDTRLLGVVAYKTAFLIVVEHDLKGVGPYRKMYPVVRENGRFFLTNSLAGDMFYERLAPVLKKYLHYAE